MSLGTKELVALSAILISGCGDAYKAAYPIDLGQAESAISEKLSIERSGDYTLSLAFPHVYERGDLDAEDKFKNLIWRGKDIRAARVWVSLANGEKILSEGEFLLNGSDGVISITARGEEVSANTRVIDTLSLPAGDYILKYRNVTPDKDLGEIDSYIVLFLDEPKI